MGTKYRPAKRHPSNVQKRQSADIATSDQDASRQTYKLRQEQELAIDPFHLRQGLQLNDAAPGGWADGLSMAMEASQENADGDLQPLWSGHMDVGGFTDDERDTRWGFRYGMETPTLSPNVRGGVHRQSEEDTLSLLTPSVGVDAHVGESGLVLGAGASVAGEAARGGELSAERQDDLLWEGGVNTSVGMGARIHWDDADGDGVREMGLGLDLGSFRGDFKSETLGRVLNGLHRWDPLWPF